ncbi:MAG TPA: capsule assembly Wzi family protein [Terracidiphilus sp.]|nr:capsule assembly Wzi family protein [Terracidiphilus sp.]
MKLTKCRAGFPAIGWLIAVLLTPATSLLAESPAAPHGGAAAKSDNTRPDTVCEPSLLDSPYVPVDSWIYPAVMRLYSMGYIDTVYLGMRPWTRASISHMLEQAGARIDDADESPLNDEAQSIYEAINKELNPDVQGPCGAHQGTTRIESVYSVVRGISGTPLRDSFHLGQSIVNDYGRPYENGFNNYSGASGYTGAGRFLLYARGEFQYAASGAGYSLPLAQELAAIDLTQFYLNSTTPLPVQIQSTIPVGPIASVSNGRWVEAYISTHVLNHEISFGKQDNWFGPGLGGGMAYSNNAENIYSFRINRIEPLHIPGLSYLTGPFRYDFMVGSLKGHNYPNSPWIHVEKIGFRPTENLEFGFERSVIWGGKDHEPITLHTFLRSFFSFSAPNGAVKNSPSDPGARFGSFDFSYRLPFMRNWLTLYSDGEVHDDLSPIDAPARAGWRPGLFLSHVPGAPKLDVRAEAAWTDAAVSSSTAGRFMYWEGIQHQGYTNKGFLLGDWIGREGKGGQGWITYHLSGNEWVQVGVRNQKVAKDFIPGGTTFNDISFQVVKRIARDFEINGKFAYDQWKAPIYPSGVPTYPASQQSDTNTTIQLTWYPERRVSF